MGKKASSQIPSEVPEGLNFTTKIFPLTIFSWFRDKFSKLWNLVFNLAPTKTVMAGNSEDNEVQKSSSKTSEIDVDQREEEAAVKGTRPLSAKSGYYYAHSQLSSADRPLVGATTIYNHSPLPAEEVKKIQRENSENGESVWNKGGTWEEKDFSKWAEGRLKELVPTLKSPNGTVTFSEVKSVDDCHATIVHSRGKKKASVEVEKIKVSYKAAAGEGKGTLEIRDLSSNSPNDIQVHVKADQKAGDQARVDADLKACKEVLKEMVRGLVEELLAK